MSTTLGHESLSKILRFDYCIASDSGSNFTKCSRPRLDHPRFRYAQYWDPWPAPFESWWPSQQKSPPPHGDGSFCFAGPPGFEPGTSVLETDVLPLKL